MFTVACLWLLDVCVCCILLIVVDFRCVFLPYLFCWVWVSLSCCLTVLRRVLLRGVCGCLLVLFTW